MQLTSHLMFAIHSSIGLSSKGGHIDMGIISSEGASAPVEGSGAPKPGRRLVLTQAKLDLCVSLYVSSFSTDS